MKMRIISSPLLLLAVCLLCAVTARAQKSDFPVIQVEAGPSWTMDMDGRLPVGAVAGEVDLNYDTGYRVDVGFGYMLRQGGLFSYKSTAMGLDLAPEIEVGLIYNSGHAEVAIPETPVLRLGIDAYQVPFLANLVFRGHFINERLTFAFGGGAGGLASFLEASGAGSDLSENDLSFAYQLLAGIQYDLSSNMTVGLGYKFLATPDLEFDDVDLDGLANHTVALSFSWIF